jgi:hypothetical protein
MNHPKHQLEMQNSDRIPQKLSTLDFAKIFFESPGRAAILDGAKVKEGSVNNSTISQEEFCLLSALSPIMRQSPFSPTKGGGLSFYETFTRRFENRRVTNPDNSHQRDPKTDFKPFAKLNTKMGEPSTEIPEKNVSTSVFNYLNSSSNSLKDYVCDKANLTHEPDIPLRLELWRVGSGNSAHNVHSTAQQVPLSLGLRPIQINDDSSRNEPEIEKLKNLCDFLESIFVCMNPSVDLYHEFTKIDEEILNSLLQRKYSKRLPLDEVDVSTERKLQVLNDIINSKSQKRPEECYKFVLTRVIKYLKKQIKDSHDCPRDLEDFLYEQYFGETAKKMDLPITDFHYPLTGNRGKFKLNSVYFDKIFKSEKFLIGANDYIQNILTDEYKMEIRKKIESLLIRWDLQLQEPNANHGEIEKHIREYLLKNKRCKLPWTMKEVNESIDRFLSLIKNYRNK